MTDGDIRIPDAVVIDKPYSYALHMELRRAEQPAPTEPGFFYSQHTHEGARYITPIFVFRLGPRLAVQTIGCCSELNEFRWFGPVPLCVESGT